MGYTMKIKEVSLTTFIEDQEQLQKWKFVPVLKYYKRSELILMYLYYRDAVLSNRKYPRTVSVASNIITGFFSFL
jgi:hypothetical protein